MQYYFENCVLDVPRRELRCNGVLRPLEPQVFDLLHFLIEHRDRLVSRDEIFRVVWRGRVVSDSVLGTRINAVRQAIGDDGKRQQFVRTIRGSGLQFVGPVSAANIAPSSPPRIAPTYRLAAALQNAPTVAVLPFTLGEDEERSGPIADTFAEEVEAALYAIDWLSVVSNHCLVNATDPAAARQVTPNSRSRYQLHGSLRLKRDDARLIIRLTDAENGIRLWIEGFDFRIASPFMAQKAIAAKTACAVSDQIFAAEMIRLRRKSSEGLTTWEALVRALDLINRRNREKAAVAQEVLRKAIEIDPQCSAAFALSSFIATLSVHQAWHARKAARPLALRAAEHAVDLDDQDPWAHVAAGYARLYVERRPGEAVEILKHALSLNPNLAVAHYLIALASSFTKKPREAFEHAQMAERLSPRDLLARGNAGAHDNVRAAASFIVGRYRDGIVFARKTLTESPRQVPAYCQLVVNCALAGELTEAAKALEAVKRLGPELPSFLLELETLYTDRADYQKYIEAFRLAGYGQCPSF